MTTTCPVSIDKSLADLVRTSSQVSRKASAAPHLDSMIKMANGRGLAFAKLTDSHELGAWLSRANLKEQISKEGPTDDIASCIRSMMNRLVRLIQTIIYKPEAFGLTAPLFQDDKVEPTEIVTKDGYKINIDLKPGQLNFKLTDKEGESSAYQMEYNDKEIPERRISEKLSFEKEGSSEGEVSYLSNSNEEMIRGIGTYLNGKEALHIPPGFHISAHLKASIKPEANDFRLSAESGSGV